MIIEVEWDTDDDEVKKALNYLAGFKEEMTSDKKHHTGVLIREVKRLREMLNIAEQNIPRRVHWDCYIDALIEAGLEEGEEE